ncbi:cytochrome c biogenesis protein CcdA [Anaerofustis stercorihominis]|uniref:Cytochrome C biogenesis protein transmembrane region n=2 Tax=Anaerofustis stercorihominis TaxID=214853 RepID=B1C7F3_9FIRM|nr:cytochrome c biogenesis protein CcdA [Anaerofustis stercorihominis]EDS72940.1 cytochrome C biogenesis protein transmembrane region [Anaerofustis stercorihominis DSM 17244]MCQ4794311.1 cytochrome C biogenesis protein CcdA [Anaerofustis stercorihominis]RGD74523.1 cytochrome C biogenesis protein CcdA [Anaerofustis stercorihominis]
MINNILESISSIITSNIYLAPIVAFFAGILVSFTPCSLSSIPLIVGYVGMNGKEDTKKLFKLSVTFAVGTALTFTVLGTLASMLGKVMTLSGQWFYIVLGVIMVLMALQTFELFNFIPSTYLVSKNEKRGYGGALLSGILAGVFSSPCSTPVLVVILGIVAGSGNILWGILLLVCYSIGHGILTVMVGTSLGLANKITNNEKYGKLQLFIKIFLGISMLLIAFYMFYLGF